MIYAIPHNHDCVANHFMKASQFTLFDNNTWVQTIANPATSQGSSCRDKSAAMQLLKQHQTDAVIVRNIGERALGKLLASGIRVFQVTGKTPLHQASQSVMKELTHASQGRPSTNHHKKGGCGGHDKAEGHSCGCGGHQHEGDNHHAHGTQHGCCGGRAQHNALAPHSAGEHGKKRAIRGLRSGILSVGKFK